ncbi:hypothetical protein, partial [Bifidobacterium breve]|uniref:hypothetical protein n=1 Tax=Bifidobacterium breve TaxID=1685 RepID=UPI0022B035C5
FYEGAIEAVKTGLLDESLIDDAVSRILALKFRLGLFEDPRLPALTASAAACTQSGLTCCSHTERPTLSQSVISVPLYFHAPR